MSYTSWAQWPFQRQTGHPFTLRAHGALYNMAAKDAKLAAAIAEAIREVNKTLSSWVWPTAK